ncbi:MAG TPA: TetR/AcrR family transcriptional regulator [Candidatus Limnocylindrales bacterium]
MDLVKPPSRRDRAIRTRHRIAEAALDLFAQDGYAATTIDAVAQRAGVAIQTVYFVFHTKPQLLVEALRIVSGGAEGTSAVMDRAWVGEVVAAPDGGRRLALAIEHGSLIYQRIGPVWPAILAAMGEPDVRAAWDAVVRDRRDGMRRVVGLMAARGELRPGLDPSLAADILFGLHRHELYLAFTVEARWSFDLYRAWTYVTLCQQLLPPEVARAATQPGSSAVAGLELANALPRVGSIAPG